MLPASTEPSRFTQKRTNQFLKCSVILSDLRNNVNGWTVLSLPFFYCLSMSSIPMQRALVLIRGNHHRIKPDDSPAKAIKQRWGQPIGCVGEQMRKVVGAFS